MSRRTRLASASPSPRRGEVWYAKLDPVRGHEQGGTRPVLVLSIDSFNASAARLVAVVPITSRIRGIASHVRIDPPEGGLRVPSEVLCEHVRFLSTDRLKTLSGSISDATVREIGGRIRVLLGL